MDSIRVSEAPDPSSILGKATNKKIIMKKIIVILATATLLMASNCKNAIQTPSYIGVENTKLDNLNFAGNTSISTQLVYNNPNNFGLSIKQTDLQVYIEDNFVGNAEQVAELKVPAKSNFSFPVKATFNTMKMLGNVLSYLGKKELKYKISGTAKLGKGGVFVKVPISITETYKIR